MNRELNIPEKLEDITLKQWQEISMIPEESEQEFYTRRILSIIYDLKGAEINKIKGTDIIKLVDAVNICLNEKPEFKNRFMMDEVEYGLIPNFDDMSFGELVDIDKYSSKEQYHKLMGVLYRPIEKTQSGDRYELEKYEKAKDMSGMRVDIALGVIGFFDYRKSVNKRYPELFDSAGSSSGKEVGFNKKWGWYTSLYALTDGNILQLDEVVEMNINKVLTWLAYKSDLVKVQQKK